MFQGALLSSGGFMGGLGPVPGFGWGSHGLHLRSTVPTGAPLDMWPILQASLCNLSWLLPSLVLSSLCMGLRTQLDPSGPSPTALPLHLESG